MSHPPLYVTEADVARLVTVDDAIAALEGVFASRAGRGTVNLTRQRARLSAGTFNLMGGAWDEKGVYGLKAYFGGKGGVRYHVLLYAADGRLLAMMEGDLFGQLRTGAASGIATRLLARPDARSLAVIGAGKQARAQVLAVCAVRPIERIAVFSRSPERREAFARALAEETGRSVQAASTAAQCVENADVIVTVTKSAEPVLHSEWVAAGAHVNAAGANSADRREIDAALVLRAARKVTDDREQAKAEAAEFRDLAAEDRLDWSEIDELGDVATGTAPGRASPADVTLFKSLGIGLEDVAFAECVYRRALAAGVAGRVPASQA
jgi:alanine dehydrogenase